MHTQGTQDMKFDKRQLNIMLQKIHAFSKGTLGFPDLIYDLEALLNILVSQEQCWKDVFIGYWWDLEQVYAVNIYNNKQTLDNRDQQIVNDSLNSLDNATIFL